MITLESIKEISPIYLTVTLIIYLMIVELGHGRIRKALFPAIVVLISVFLIIAGMSVYSQITR
jgi:hypothetical protein